ncbi:MAG: thioredoxin [Treponema sp.]|jgi:thioredoxin 1|nr:thioredoxin [Treponema sp.]
MSDSTFVITITGENFEAEVLKSPLPVLVDFWAAWCGPCKMIGPFIEQIGAEYSGRLKVGKVNVDEQGELANRHGIASIPTLVVYKNGSLVQRQTGAAQKSQIETLFKEFL